ncbi:hypothetical protein FB567DRAFT_211696 [Paraphoma chrysanthemicola]|uniref:Uncharacterized protein n=1 Tax=Paraphoma chrysanthemicola TaxID=798071 RepID=A0A8K0QUP6_9PLEO|nr:hypothetical protein FB567DRAFT_211696 [Paraphoma chrysanthemicola]
MATAGSPVSPIALTPIPTTPVPTRPVPTTPVSTTPNPTTPNPATLSPTTPIPTTPRAAPTNATTSSVCKGSWLPFTLQWYYLVLPTLISLCLGGVLVFLSVYSKQNQGIAADSGSSAILFGWRFTPTLIAVLYAQMTVILFEDVKRTEPFARLAKAPAGGAGAYGTLLQTPRAWWSILTDVCFRRKRIGKTSWTLICAALINVIALLAISPLSSALLTSEEVLIAKAVDFERITPKSNVQLTMAPTRETYYRTLNSLLRSTSTSAWVTNTSMTFPFWPASGSAQFGPRLASSSQSWNAKTTTIKSDYKCKDMTLVSANMAPQRYFDVYTVQGYGPLNGTQPMITFILTSDNGCRYQLMMHPSVDMAYFGGVTWSNATTFYPTITTSLPVGGRLYSTNVTSTHIYARVNASEQCDGHDIILMSTPWTAPFNFSASPTPLFIPQNQTYVRSSEFHMRGLLCKSEYTMSDHSMKVLTSASASIAPNATAEGQSSWREIPGSLLNVPQFERSSMQDVWISYFDEISMLSITARSNTKLDMNGGEADVAKPGFSGMAPLLAAMSNYNLSSMIVDQDIVHKAALAKGRFFSETVREAFNKPDLVDSVTTRGEILVLNDRVVVLTEIGFALAALFFASCILLIAVFWSSRLRFRPLNLRSDPASLVGMSLLLNRQLDTMSTLRSMHNASRVDLYTALQKEKFLTSNNDLLKGNDSADPPIKVKPRRNWRPTVIHVRMLLALGLFLALVLIAVLVLNAFSARSQLSQLAFIYEADISNFGLSFSTFAPISIAPTVVSIVVGLWWDQLDMTWRVLQPFIAMSRGPTPINTGAGLTYRSKSWMGAAVKAGRNKHWVLLLVAIGSVLAQVLTVSMSALFERQTRTVTQELSLPRSLELRQNPLSSGVNLAGDLKPANPAMEITDQLYTDISKNWLYGAGTQQNFNGSQLPWTADGWSFLPIDLSKMSSVMATQSSASESDSSSATSTIALVNATLSIPAIRARLECRPVPSIANISSWVTLVDLANKTDSFEPGELERFNQTGKIEMYSMPMDIFKSTDAHTNLLSTYKEPACCQNGSIDNPQRAALGYWSPALPANDLASRFEYPYEDLGWPLKIVPKWVVGKAVVLGEGRYGRSLYFKEMPRLQAAQCDPIIETAEATISLDAKTGNVYSHRILGSSTKTDVAWADAFTRHANSTPKIDGIDSSLTQNMTASYGVMFLDTLLGSADRQVGRHGKSWYEETSQNAFVFRDAKNGINLDLMTYSMFTLAGQDPEALLNFTTLATTADQTFQTFFQQFVNSELSLSKGGYAYQPIGDNTMESLGPSIDANGTLIAEKRFPVLNTNRTITASVSHRIRVLHMNTTATYLSTAILIWLIFTTITVLCLQRKYTSFMHRDVQLIADMLVLVAGSDNFLALVADKGVHLKRNRDIKTMLGWFRDTDGHIRWGVEVIGGPNAVDWVDAPKTGFHVSSPKTSRSIFARIKWW